MPTVTIRKQDECFSGEVAEGANLVVQAATRRFPYPHLNYGCGIGQCGRCASRILSGAEHLPAPNWKEQRRLGEEWLAQGYRLMCQLFLTNDLELVQDRALRPPHLERRLNVRDSDEQTRPVQD